MPQVENPPGFVIREEAHKAAYENGFRISRETRDGWIGYASTTAPGDVWVGRATNQGPWLLSITHAAVAAELGIPPTTDISGPAFATFALATLGDLYQALDRVYKLGVSLPDAPFEAFQRATANLPRTTEVERLTVQRVGQDLFRQALLDYWGGRCPLTGITDPKLLRASHIVPWAECESDALRLDVHNGLLLSALWDAAFDAGLISFADDGTVLRSPSLTAAAATALHLDASPRIDRLTDFHRLNLVRQRNRHAFSTTNTDGHKESPQWASRRESESHNESH